MDKRIKELEKIFNGDISDWMMLSLPQYLDARFDAWAINPLSENTAEIYISGYGDVDEWESEEDMFEETMYIAFDLLEEFGVVDIKGTVMEVIPDFALSNFYVHPLHTMIEEVYEEVNSNVLLSEGIREWRESN